MAKFLKSRLDFNKTSDKIKSISGSEIFILIGVCLLAGFFIKIPDLFNFNLKNFFFYEKNAGIIVFFGLSFFTICINRNFTNRRLLITILIFVVSIIYINMLPSDKDSASVHLAYIHLPLLISNILLIGVMVITSFLFSETSISRKQKLNEMVLFVLSIITLINNLIALSAIFYRLNEYGLTPNRLAILGSNILIFCNLILTMIDLFKINFKKPGLEKVEMTISKYLPIYVIWTFIVVFGFPLIFGIK